MKQHTPTLVRFTVIPVLAAVLGIAAAPGLLAQGTWTVHRQMDTRIAPIVFDQGRNRVVMFGGLGRSSSAVAGTWEWDGVDWTQRTPAISPPTRKDHAMAYDATRGMSLMFGGTTGSAELGDTWEWTGTDWVQRAPANAPSPRESSGMAFDPGLGQVLLFDGRTAHA